MPPVSAPPQTTVSLAEDGQGPGPVAIADPHAARAERIRNVIFARFPRDKTPKIALLEKAFGDSEHHHRNQTRKSGEPYFLHPLRVALMVTEAGLDPEAVIIALLHDVIEDTEMTKGEVQARYGDWLADVVDGLTKAAAAQGRDAGVATYRKLISSSLKDLRTLQVKLFDRLDNMRDLGYLERLRQRRISQETLNVYVPMAQRLGMMDIADELTALCFRYLYPRRFNATLVRLKQRISDEQAKLNSLRQLLESILAEQKINEAQVKPHLLRISDFIHRDLPPGTALTGFTVSVPSEQDCYQALGAVHIKCRVVPNSIKDFISNPKPNRYQALHSLIFLGGEPVALVVCSRRMEAINRSGILANWKGSNEDLRRYYQSYLDLLDQYTDTDDLRMEDVLRHAQLETLQMFTPKGKLLSLPQGASVIDFAFAIHTDLGLHCAGARMAGKWVGPFTELRDGDVVEIFPEPSAAPAPEWLEHVRTTRAQLAIRRFLKLRAGQRAQDLGGKLFAAELKRLGTSAEAMAARPEFQHSLSEKGLTLAQFHHQIGTRKLHLRKFLVDQGLVPRKSVERLEGQQSLLKRYLRPMFSSRGPVLEIPERGDGFITLSPCCQPLVGDPIVGVQADQGFRIHRGECPELAQADPDSLISVAWEEGTQKRPYRLELRLQDRAGMIYKISKVMRDCHVSIHDLDLDRHGGVGDAVLRVLLEPITSKTYQKIVARLRGIKEIGSIRQADAPPAPPSPRPGEG
jgi:RelA/SpoT family (p)ppGpp synthetase